MSAAALASMSLSRGLTVEQRTSVLGLVARLETTSYQHESLYRTLQALLIPAVTAKSAEHLVQALRASQEVKAALRTADHCLGSWSSPGANASRIFAAYVAQVTKAFELNDYARRRTNAALLLIATERPERFGSTPERSPLVRAAVEVAGYRIEGPDSSDPDLRGRFWWTLGRAGWSGYEASPQEWATADEATRDAYRHLLSEDELPDVLALND